MSFPKTMNVEKKVSTDEVVHDVANAAEDFFVSLKKTLDRDRIVIIRQNIRGEDPIVESITKDEYVSVRYLLHSLRKRDKVEKAKRNRWVEMIVGMGMEQKDFFAYWHSLSEEQKEELRTREF